MECSVTNLVLILNNSVEYIMQGRMPKLTFPSAVELVSLIPVIIRVKLSSTRLDKK